MRDFIDYYKILQVHHEADIEIISAAYRCFSKRYHPDLNADLDAKEMMALINTAYDVLGNSSKRKTYHQQWLEANGIKNIGPFHTKNPIEEKKLKEQASAKLALWRFFDYHIHEKWEESYRDLTQEDQTNIPLDDYIKWKDAVAALYRLTEYNINYVSTHTSCEYGGTVYPEILHFSIELTETELATGKMNVERTVKYVAWDGNQWRVCLGYTELKSSIRKLHYLAKAMPKPDRDEWISRALARLDPITGLYSRKGFEEELLKELRRSKRYGNPLSLGVIELRPRTEFEEQYEQDRDVIIAEVADIISRGTRETDIIGRIDDSAFALLFIETISEQADVPIGRLAQTAYSEEGREFDLYRAFTKAAVGESATSWIDRTHARVELIGHTLSHNDEIRLGKYHLSDILEFNKKGRIHF